MNVFEKIQSSGLNIHELRRQNITFAEIANLVNDEIDGNVSKSSIIKYFKEVAEETTTTTEKVKHNEDFERFGIMDFIVLSTRNLAKRIYIQSLEALEDDEETISSQDVTMLKNLLGMASVGGMTISHINDRVEAANKTLDSDSVGSLESFAKDSEDFETKLNEDW